MANNPSNPSGALLIIVSMIISLLLFLLSPSRFSLIFKQRLFKTSCTFYMKKGGLCSRMADLCVNSCPQDQLCPLMVLCSRGDSQTYWVRGAVQAVLGRNLLLVAPTTRTSEVSRGENRL